MSLSHYPIPFFPCLLPLLPSPPLHHRLSTTSWRDIAGVQRSQDLALKKSVGSSYQPSSKLVTSCVGNTTMPSEWKYTFHKMEDQLPSAMRTRRQLDTWLLRTMNWSTWFHRKITVVTWQTTLKGDTVSDRETVHMLMRSIFHTARTCAAIESSVHRWYKWCIPVTVSSCGAAVLAVTHAVKWWPSISVRLRIIQILYVCM